MTKPKKRGPPVATSPASTSRARSSTTVRGILARLAQRPREPGPQLVEVGRGPDATVGQRVRVVAGQARRVVEHRVARVHGPSTLLGRPERHPEPRGRARRAAAHLQAPAYLIWS